jgi:hypothetical protein
MNYVTELKENSSEVLKICTNVNGKRKQDLVISYINQEETVFHEIEDKTILI